MAGALEWRKFRIGERRNTKWKETYRKAGRRKIGQVGSREAEEC